MEGIREKRKGTPISNRLSHRQRGDFTYKEVSGHWPLPFPTYSYPKVSIQQWGSEWWFRMAHFWEWAHPDLVLKEQATIPAHSGKGPSTPKAVYRKHKMEMRGDNSTARPSAEHCEELISPIFWPYLHSRIYSLCLCHLATSEGNSSALPRQDRGALSRREN